MFSLSKETPSCEIADSQESTKKPVKSNEEWMVIKWSWISLIGETRNWTPHFYLKKWEVGSMLTSKIG